jgi:hypothetical protein
MPLLALALPFLLFETLVALAILSPRLLPGVRTPLALMPSLYLPTLGSPLLGDILTLTWTMAILYPGVLHTLSPMGGCLTTPLLPLIVGGLDVQFHSMGGTPFPVPHSVQHGGVTFTLLGHHVPLAGVPSFVFGSAAVPGDPGLGGYPHVPSSVASSFSASSLPLRPLPHQDARSLSDSNVSQSFGFQSQFVAPPDTNPVPPVDLPRALAPS